MSVRRAHRSRLIAFLLVAIAAALFFAFDLHAYLTLATFKSHQAELAAAFRADPVEVAALFMAIQITALTLSLPGAVLTLSLAAGGIFGALWGSAIALASIVIGDSLAFLAARHLFRSWVERIFGSTLATVNHGVHEDGAFYLLSLRLMAIVPFFVVNLTMGLTRMRLKLFAPISLIGLIPATIIYVNAGTELARIDEASDIYSARLVLAFLLLGAFPLAARYLFRRFHKRKASLEGQSS